MQPAVYININTVFAAIFFFIKNFSNNSEVEDEGLDGCCSFRLGKNFLRRKSRKSFEEGMQQKKSSNEGSTTLKVVVQSQTIGR